ncbi:MAG: response regulator [Candidatus Thiodiazotropha sp.]
MAKLVRTGFALFDAFFQAVAAFARLRHFHRRRPDHGAAEATIPARSQADAGSDPLHLGDAEVVLVSRNWQHVEALSGCMRSWGRSCAVVESGVEAVCRLLNQYDNTGAGPDILIVDASGLGMDPVHLPTMLAAKTSLAGMRLLCLHHPASPDEVRELIDAGYSGIIESPIRKSQLFALIEATPDNAILASNVVDLSHHRRCRQRESVRKRVLLADQSAMERTRLETLLRDAGHWVKSVENGEQALDAMERQHFDMAVINLRLPIMNGTQVIKLHRFTTPHQRWVPFIVITDQKSPSTLRLCRELSIEACLFKPVPADALLEALIATTPKPAQPRRQPSPMIHARETRFLHADMLDRSILEALDGLDHEQGLVPELIEVFERDCTVVLNSMRQALERRQRERFVNLVGLMVDNAGQLGAFALYEMCLGLSRMGRVEFEREAAERLLKLSQLVASTMGAFHEYLAERDADQSDRNY